MRKYGDHDDREGRERTPEEPAEDPLKDATTLYVGNLYVDPVLQPMRETKLMLALQVLLHNRRTDP